MEKIRNKHILGILFALIVVLGFFLIYNYFNLGTKVLDSSFIIGDTPGFDLSPDALTFGRVVEGNGASRSISIDNSFSDSVKIQIRVKGEISDYLRVAENEFVLQPGETREVMFNVYAPEGMEYRVYEGKVMIKTSRCLNEC